MDYVKHGNYVKMNPPLREHHLQDALLDRVLNGSIDIIGSDHAPHTYEAKNREVPASGIPAIPFWPNGIKELLAITNGNQVLIERLCFEKANELFFDGNIKKEYTEIEENRDVMWLSYGYNPFERMVDK